MFIHIKRQKAESIEENAVNYGDISQVDTCLLCHADQRHCMNGKKGWRRITNEQSIIPKRNVAV